MKKFISFLILSIACSTYLLADVFMTELTDPQNSSDAGRYVELYNNGDAVVDLSSGWSVQRWTNANADPTSSSMVNLTGTITPGGFYIICNDANKFATTYGGTCDQDIGTGGFADSNGDDNMALLFDGSIVDMFGVPGEDGTGTGHEFEDGRAERAADNTSASATWNEAGWNIDNDSGGGDGNQYAPEGFDPGEWIGAGDAPSDVYGCMDLFGLNFNSEATADDGSCEYADHQVEAGSMYFSPADLVINMGESVQWNNVGGFHDAVADDGSFGFDACDGPCLIGSHTFADPGTYSYICSVYGHAGMGMVGTVTVVDPTVEVTFSVDMNLEGVTGDVSVRTSTVNGDYSPSDWFAMDDSDGDLVYTYTLSLLPGVEYGYNFHDGGYESGDGLADCAEGNYGNDRYVMVADDAMILDTVCWESCDACPDVIPGCTDEDALNFDENATEDDGSCQYPQPAANLFFSEHAEGSSNNKYFEVYNASDADVSLADYVFVNCSNGCTDWEYTNSFADGATVAAGDVYVVCHSSADEDGIIPFCDETRTLYHNGDDAQGLMHVTDGLLDVFGAIGDDPGSGWEAAGVANATKDHTLVRKSSVTSGNIDWASSAGTNSDDSEWIVLDQNTWDYLGSHPHDFSTAGCTDTDACNYDADATEDDGSCLYNDCLGECGGAAVEDDCGVCEGDGSSCLVDVTFSVDMNLEGVVGDIKVRTSTVNGEYNPSDWFTMDDSDGDLVFTHTLSLSGGVTYGYNFNNSDGSGYESGSGLGDCAGGNYGNDRYVTPGDAAMTLDTVCWESCDACPEVIPGCTDDDALNFDENATEDDGSCIYDWPDAANLFFSEAAEGSSNNKYLEIYNASGADVDMSGYSLSSCSNGCDDGVSWDYADNVTFAAGTTVAAGDVYVVCHGSADDVIQAECDQTFTYLSNGDDVFGLTQIGSGLVLDIIGVVGDDPGSGWDAAGVSNATKDHTLVRKSSVTSGNTDWESSAGTDADNSEWVVLDQNTWDYVGSHPHEFAVYCEDESACNNGAEGDCEYSEENFDCDGNCTIDVDCAGVCGGDAFTDCAGSCVAGAYLSWIGDGYCDDGAWGVDFVSCGDFNCDDGDCGTELLEDGTCGTACAPGDVNGDGTLDVLDVVSVVGDILDGIEGDACADMNGDGTVDVLDVVSMVNIILVGRTTSDATEARLNIDNGIASLEANGFVGAVQMTLSHQSDFSIELTDKAMVADYRINGNSTTLIIVAPESNELFTASDDFTVEDVIVANANGMVDFLESPTEFTLSKAYPNPFNPSTTLEVSVPVEGYVSISVYNVMGQLVDMIHSGNLTASTHEFTWNAASLTSGTYFVRAESAAGVDVQKVMLMK